MKIYFYSTHSDQPTPKRIIGYLKKMGVAIMDAEAVSPARPSATNDPGFSKVDALIVEGAKLDAQAGYLIAMSLSQGRDVLCLLPRGSSIDDTLKSLQTKSSFAKKLHLDFYGQDNVVDKLSDFLQSLDKGSLADLVNIKYTLRVSRKINEYLDWKAKATGVNKADRLRDLIKDTIDNDKDYQKYLQSKFSTR